MNEWMNSIFLYKIQSTSRRTFFYKVFSIWNQDNSAREIQMFIKCQKFQHPNYEIGYLLELWSNSSQIATFLDIFLNEFPV